MPTYISVTKPTSRLADAKTASLAKALGPAIIEPFEALLNCFAETHDDNMVQEGGRTKHRREEPKCCCCVAIRNAQKTLRAIKGREL